MMIVSPIHQSEVAGNKIDNEHLSNVITDSKLSNENYKINSSGQLSGQKYLSFGQSFTSPMMIKNGQVVTNFSNVTEDLLQYRTNFKQLWENNSQSHDSFFDTKSNEASLAVTTPSSGLIYTIPANKTITDKIIVQFSVKDFVFNLPQGTNGYLVTIFEFNSISIRYVLYSTPLFDVYQQNSTTNLSIYWNDKPSSVNISKFFEPSLYPTKLKDIKIQSVGYNYTYNITFDELGVLQKQDFVKLNGGNQILLQSQSPLLKGEQYSIQLDNDTIADIRWKLEFQETIEIQLKISLDSLELFGSGELIISKEYLGYTMSYSLNTVFESYKLNKTDYMRSEAIIFVNQTSRQTIYGKFNFIDNMKTITGIQGENLTIHVNQGCYKGVIFKHKQAGNISQSGFNESKLLNTLNMTIPLSWRKGSIAVFILPLAGGYYSFNITLDKSPARLVSPSHFTLFQGQQTNLPVVLENITSQMRVNATRIETYRDNLLRSIDNYYGIRIEAGEFMVGDHILQVNASVPGFVNVVFDLTLTILTPDLQIRNVVTRTSATQAIVDVSALGLVNISAPAELTIPINGRNETRQLSGVYSEISITNSSWQADQSYQIYGLITIGNNITQSIFIIRIPVYEKNMTGSIIFSIVSFTGIVGIMTYKLYNHRFGDKSINF